MSEKFALHPKFYYIVLLLAVDCFSVLAWLPAIFQKNSLSIVGTMWLVLSLLTTVLIGILIFGEKLSLIEIAGIILAIISVILLSIA